MIKKTVITIVGITILAVCLCMAGCGGSDDSSDAPVIGTCTVTIADQLEETEYDINEGDTIYDVMMKTGIAISAEDTGNGLSIEAIGGVANGDLGKLSGWLFTVNGEMPMDYCDKITVNDGDEIVWDFAEGM